MTETFYTPKGDVVSRQESADIEWRGFRNQVAAHIFERAIADTDSQGSAKDNDAYIARGIKGSIQVADQFVAELRKAK